MTTTQSLRESWEEQFLLLGLELNLAGEKAERIMSFISRTLTTERQQVLEEVQNRLIEIAEVNEELAGEVVGTLDGTSPDATIQSHLDVAKAMRREAGRLSTIHP